MEGIIKILGIIATISVVYVLMAVYKRLIRKQENDVWRRLIPMWAVLLGIGLGILFSENIPEIMPLDGLLPAMILGGIAGWGSVGANQFAKLTLGEDRFRAVIKAEKVIIKEDKQSEDKPTDTKVEEENAR